LKKRKLVLFVGDDDGVSRKEDANPCVVGFVKGEIFGDNGDWEGGIWCGRAYGRWV